MTTTKPPDGQKPNLWALMGESFDLSKALGSFFKIAIVVGGIAWWIITRDNQNSLTQYQVQILSQRMDKVEQNTSDQKVILATYGEILKHIQDDVHDLRPVKGR